MDWQGIYDFLFQSYAGIGVLFLIVIVICLVACVIMEHRTRKQYFNHEKTEDDWSFFDDEDEQGADEA